MPARTASHLESKYAYDRQSNDITFALNQQRLNTPSPDIADMCDVIVLCTCGEVTSGQQQSIRAHRCVLATSSEYFQTLFSLRLEGGGSGTMSRITEVNLPFVSRDIVEKVIEFLYTGVIWLSLESLPEVLRLADYLRISQLLQICADVLSDYLDLCNVLQVRHLIDTYNLSAVRPKLSATVSDLVSRHLPEILHNIGRRRSLNGYPPQAINRLLEDGELGSVRERDIFDAVCRCCRNMTIYRDSSFGNNAWDLLESVEFDYLPIKFLRDKVLGNVTVHEWMRCRRPDILRNIEGRIAHYTGNASGENDPSVIMARSSDYQTVDVIICRSRSMQAFDRGPVRLVIYDIQEDEWNFLRPPGQAMVRSRRRFNVSTAAAVNDDYSLEGLESLVVHAGQWLYALCTSTDDSYGVADSDAEQVESKRFWCLDLQASNSSWKAVEAPSVVQSQCRLSADNPCFVYAVDRSGRVERYSVADGHWRPLCRIGFATFPNATLYNLIMPVSDESPLSYGGKYPLYVVRAFSSGYCFYFSSKSVAVYRLRCTSTPPDHGDASETAAEYEWNVLERSEIEFADLISDDPSNYADVVHFHGYVLTGRRIDLTDELGRRRATYDLNSRDWILETSANNQQPVTIRPSTTVKVPQFVGTVLGSVSHADHVYCSTRISAVEDCSAVPVQSGRGGFVMYDHARRRYKAVTSPPVPLSGLMCRATMSRSALIRLHAPPNVTYSTGDDDVEVSDFDEDQEENEKVDFDLNM